MTHIKTFTLFLALTFGAPWFFLVVYPHVSMSSLAPVVYSEDELETAEGTTFPPGVSGRVANGHEVYVSEGCVYCHTQMVRNTDVAKDMWHAGWGGRGENWDGSEGKAVPLREPRPQDYLGESYALLGIQRNGPDLSNVGWRRPDKAWLHQMLYSPRSLAHRSAMPAYKHLYKVRPIGPQPSADAVQLEGKFAPAEGYEVVPTKEADALVSYLLSLKKDYLVPASLGGKGATAQPEAAATAKP